MSHLLNSVNNVKSSTNGDINLGLSSLISSPSDTDVVGIDGSGNSKKLAVGTEIGTQGLSYVTQSGGWSGAGSVNMSNGFQLRMRGSSCTIITNTSLVTPHTAGGAGWIIGWTVVPGNYIFILNNAIDTSFAGSCDAQVYNVATSSHVGPKIHYEEGNFSTTLVYYASVSSNTRFEYRVLNVIGTSRFFGPDSMFSCTFNIFKV
jgi:hypothetical protein